MTYRAVVTLSALPSEWRKASRSAIKDLNALFRRAGIPLLLAEAGSPRAMTIRVKVDAAMSGFLTHGKTSTVSDPSTRRPIRADVRVPTVVMIKTPRKPRPYGPGVLKVIIAHEFVHALGHDAHNSHLMTDRPTAEMGDSPRHDVLRAGSVRLPPIGATINQPAQQRLEWVKP